MDNKPDFCEILAHSERLEMVRLDRELNALMEDEFVLDRELEQKLCNGSYHFPDVSEIRTDKQVLTRTQAYFSAKIHVRRTPVYFHNHEFIEMLYMYEGRCRQFIENLSQCILLKEGDLFLLNQNVTHALQTEGRSTLIKVIIPTDWVSHEFIQEIDHESALFDFFVNTKVAQGEYYHYLHFPECAGIKKMIEIIMIEYYHNRKYSTPVIRNYLQMLMFQLDRTGKVFHECRRKMTQSALQMGRLKQYVYDHSDSVTLKELAGKFHFNQSYLSRIIAQNCGMGFQELVKECRIEKSAMLLGSSDYSIEQIAEIVGYQNATSVYNGIKDKFGISPAEYRRRYGKMNGEMIENE